MTGVGKPGALSLGILLLMAAAVANPARAAESRSEMDGPAELPRVYLKTAMADTPAPGKFHNVKADDSLQEALESAHCGDTLKLEAGATFTGNFKFPDKSCDDSHWIILRTSAPDSALPPEGTRLTPCYAGVASLPSRPDFHCSSPRNVMAKIQFDGKGGTGPILLLEGANHYRFVGIEITRGNPGAKIGNLIAPKEGGTANHLIFDRVWIHGTAQDETKGGVHLSGVVWAAVIDSTFTDLHCIAGAGACTDAQAVNGGNGDHPGGPYKIVNNFLEASGENLFFGGAAGTSTPTDIEIRRNHLFKPLIWKADQPGFVGSAEGKPFIVKNHFELKNAQRVLFEGNILENVWGGFSQAGFSILLTPKSQAGKCPSCRVTDVTIRYCRLAHVAAAITIANILSTQNKGASSEGGRYSIHDIVVDDINGEAYKGFGSFAFVGSISPPLKDVSIDHVTAFPEKVLISLHSPTDGPKISNFNVTNSVFTATPRQIGNAGGGKINCAFMLRLGPAGIWDSCFTDSKFTHNLIIGGSGGWPPGNIIVKDEKEAGLIMGTERFASEARLCRDKSAGGCAKVSPAIGAGSDGKDLGADLAAISKATEGVE
jgi:hypothetical protein